jgi:hypothetical protein
MLPWSGVGTIRISVANAKTAVLECGRYMDALQVTIGDIVSPLWTGVILVAANPEARATDMTEAPMLGARWGALGTWWVVILRTISPTRIPANSISCHPAAGTECTSIS